MNLAAAIAERILDVFVGSLATGLAALGLGRDAICVEKNLEVLARALHIVPEVSA